MHRHDCVSGVRVHGCDMYMCVRVLVRVLVRVHVHVHVRVHVRR